jgi:phosphate transport system substrate-binding protein
MAIFHSYKCPNKHCKKHINNESISISVRETSECSECGAKLVPIYKLPVIKIPIVYFILISILIILIWNFWPKIWPKKCEPPMFLDMESNTCIGCISPSVFNSKTNRCETRQLETAPTQCILPKDIDPSTNTCKAPPETLLRFHGSNTIGGKLLPALAEAFLKQQGYSNIHKLPGAKEDEGFIVGEQGGKESQIEIQAHGSDTAFEDLKDGLCDIGMSSRKIKSEELQNLKDTLGDLSSNSSEHVLAMDGIAIIIHPENPVKTLSVSQLADIFSGTLSDWSLVGGEPRTITLYARDEKAGTYDFFKKQILDPYKKILAHNAERFEDSKKLSEAVNGDRGGIGFIGFNYVLSNKTIALSDNCFKARKPNLLTIKTENYRLTRRLYLYTPEKPSNPIVKKFIEFAVGVDGQKVVQSTGLVNMDPTPVASDDSSNDVRNQSARWHKMTNGAIEIASHIHFRIGGNDLDSRANLDIKRIGEVLTIPQYQNKKVILLGFADSNGFPRKNCELSKERAEKVKQELDLDGLAFQAVVGLCDEAPIAPNDLPECREKNRRVEVWLK